MLVMTRRSRLASSVLACTSDGTRWSRWSAASTARRAEKSRVTFVKPTSSPFGFRNAVWIDQTQMCALSLFFRPPFHQARAFAPALNDAVAVHQEQGVVAQVLGDEGVDEVGVQPLDLGSTPVLGRRRSATCNGGLTLAHFRARISLGV